MEKNRPPLWRLDFVTGENIASLIDQNRNFNGSNVLCVYDSCFICFQWVVGGGVLPIARIWSPCPLDCDASQFDRYDLAESAYRASGSRPLSTSGRRIM